MPAEVLAPVMRLAVLSDVHLGRGDAETGYAGAPEVLCAALEAIAKHADLVIINGDLYDLDRGLFPVAQGLEYKALQPRWTAVETTIAALGIRLTTGNHDHALRGRIVAGARVQESYRVQVGPLAVHVEHGERFNAWVKQSRWVTSAVTWLSGRVSQGVFRPVYRVLRAMEARTTDDREGGVTSRARDWLQSTCLSDVLIIGHTHQRHAEACAGKWLLNPGDSMCTPFKFLWIDGHLGEVHFGDADSEGGLNVTQRLALFPVIGNDRGLAAPVM